MNPIRGLLFSWLAATLPPAGVGESQHTAKCLLLHLLLLLPPGVKEKKGKETVENLWFSPGDPSGGRGVRISPFRVSIPALVLPAMRLPFSRIRLASLVVLAVYLPPATAQFSDEKPRGPMDHGTVDSPKLRADLGEISDPMLLCATLDGREDAPAFLRSDRASLPQSRQRSAARLHPGTLRAQAGNDPGRAIAPVPGAPPFPRSLAGPTASTEPTTQAEASAMMMKYRASLIFVSGTVGAGSGFIGQLRGTTFLFTNAHVAAGVKGADFKTLEGTQVQLGTPAIAVGHDIFLTTLAPGKPAIEIMIGVDQNAAVGDGVVVLGNAEGGGVINTIIGKIVGIGPDRVEVDAPFQPGNSGSPIIHLKSGKVIGVATYLTIKKYDAATKRVLANPVVRRFGYRLDSVKKWEPVAWPVFYAQAGQMEKIEQLTADLEKFLIDIAEDHRVSLRAHNHPAIKWRIDQWQASKERESRDLSPTDMARINQTFIASIKNACRSDMSMAQPQMTYDYFQRQFTGEQQIREEMAEILHKIIQDIKKDR